MLWVVTLLALGFLTFPSYVVALIGESEDGPAVASRMNQAIIRVEGMTCSGCAVAVAEAIRTVPGVRVINVDYHQAHAVVGVARPGDVPTHAILRALKVAGYAGRIKSAELQPSLH